MRWLHSPRKHRCELQFSDVAFPFLATSSPLALIAENSSSFVRFAQVGDFPELDPFASDDEGGDDNKDKCCDHDEHEHEHEHSHDGHSHGEATNKSAGAASASDGAGAGAAAASTTTAAAAAKPSANENIMEEL